MTKAEFLQKAAELYRFGSLQDTDLKTDWTPTSMMSEVCGALDSMVIKLSRAGVISGAELQAFYDAIYKEP